MLEAGKGQHEEARLALAGLDHGRGRRGVSGLGVGAQARLCAPGYSASFNVRETELMQ